VSRPLVAVRKHSASRRLILEPRSRNFCSFPLIPLPEIPLPLSCHSDSHGVRRCKRG